MCCCCQTFGVHVNLRFTPNSLPRTLCLPVMPLSTRLIVALVTLLGTLAVQCGLGWHLSAPGPLEAVPLVEPLAAVPLQLGDWQGKDRAPQEGATLYGDEYIQRDYTHRTRRQTVALWATYSHHGEDRGHHPEVCMVVAGKREDPTVRQTCPVGDEEHAVQQYRFAGPLGDRQLVFYWHYTMPPEDPPGITAFQKLYQRLRRRPSSLTVEVFAPESRRDDDQYAREFVELVDQALAAHAGPAAIRGNVRLPVTVVEPSRVPAVE